jgi:hypothetical protein
MKILHGKKRFFIVVVLVILLAMFSVVSRSSKNIRVPAGWTVHNIKYGSSVSAPKNWKFQLNSKNGAITLNGPQNEKAIIWPLFSPKIFNVRAAQLTLSELKKQIWPGAIWGRPVGPLPNVVQINGHKNTDTGIVLLTWVETPKGASICVYSAISPSKIFKPSVSVFTRIFKSFKAAGPALSKKPAEIKYAVWEDTREHAFTLEVPQSWETQGGAYRYAPLDVRLEIQSFSPDKQVMVQMGDIRMPIYAIPNQLLSMGGFNEGSYYSPGYGIKEMVLHYLPGSQYARYYTLNYLSKICSNIHISYIKNRWDISEKVNQVYAENNLPIRLDTGEVRFTCLKNNLPLKGYVFAGTYRTSTLWGVMYLYVVLAPPQKFNGAMAILAHEIATFRENPSWIAMNEHIAVSASHIIARAGNKIENIISSSYQYRETTMNEIQRREENAILGENDVVDPASGEDYKVDSGSNYYWMSPDGHIVGTNIDSVPNHNINFRKMLLRP